MAPFFRHTISTFIAIALQVTICDTVLFSQTSTHPPATVKMQKGLPIPLNPDVIQARAKAQACAPATALRDLEWNNVRALIENGGTL